MKTTASGDPLPHIHMYTYHYSDVKKQLQGRNWFDPLFKMVDTKKNEKSLYLG